MKVTNPEAAIKLLRRARELMAHEFYICHAIAAAFNVDGHEEPAGIELRGYIEQHIRDNATTPIRGHLPPVFERCIPDHILGLAAWDEDLARLAWIDRMIFQLEQDGTLP